MLDKEKLRKKFQNHEAKLTDYGNIKILDFKNPESNEYRIRFLFEEDYYKLHISGDLGELTASNYKNMCYDDFDTFVNDSGYFEEKIDCHSRALYTYNEKLAKEQILQYFIDNDICEDPYGIYYDSPKDAFDNVSEDIFTDFSDDTGISDIGMRFLADEMDIDIYYDLDVRAVGKTPTGIIDLYLAAFELAKKRLNKELSKGEK